MQDSSVPSPCLWMSRRGASRALSPQRLGRILGAAPLPGAGASGRGRGVSRPALCAALLWRRHCCCAGFLLGPVPRTPRAGGQTSLLSLARPGSGAAPSLQALLCPRPLEHLQVSGASVVDCLFHTQHSYAYTHMHAHSTQKHTNHMSARTQHSQTHKPHVCTHAALTNTPHVCTHAAHTNTQITCMHARSTHVNAHTCTHCTHVHTHSTHTGTRSATHPCTHSTHMQPHEALCLTPAGARGGRLQCRASAPRCPWTLRGFSAQGRTPEALARGCLKASRPAALLMAGGEKRLGPEGQTEQNHSDSLGAARAPRGSNTTGFCRARPGLNPTVKWPSLPASQTVARGGLWAAASVGPLAVSWASGSSQRPCSPGRPSLHQLTSKPR